MNLVNGDMSQMAEFGQHLVALGKALQKPSTRLDKLAVLALRCGMKFHVSLSTPYLPATPDTIVVDIPLRIPASLELDFEDTPE